MLRLPTQFTYHRPTTVAEAVALAGEHGPQSMYVAGGTDLYPNMKRRQQTPEHVIALGGIEELHGIRGSAGEGFTIGAMTTLSEIEHDAQLQEHHPAVAGAADAAAVSAA